MNKWLSHFKRENIRVKLTKKAKLYIFVPQVKQVYITHWPEFKLYIYINHLNMSVSIFSNEKHRLGGAEQMFTDMKSVMPLHLFFFSVAI